MIHLSNFIETVGAIAFMETIGKPLIVRFTKKIIKKADNHIEIIPNWIHSKEED